METVAKVRSCVVTLDLECDDLILEMFETFFDTASDEQPHNVFVAMRNMLTVVLEESEKILAAIVEVIMENRLKQKKVGLAELMIVRGVVSDVLGQCLSSWHGALDLGVISQSFHG